MSASLRTVGVGLKRGIIDGRTGQRAEGTMAELEADLQRVREMGAPDNASIAQTGSGSIYTAEILWVEP